jgi:phosphatidylserine decarboxylase
MQRYGKDRPWPFAEGGEVTITIFTILWGTAVFLFLRMKNSGTGLLLTLITGLWGLILYFFRDPNRQTVDEPGLVVGPGDGEIVEIAPFTEFTYLQEETIRVSMFLSVTNVHIQRVPLGGKVTIVDHRPGRYLQAFRPEASDVNEYIAMVTESEYGRVLIKQIAGILARRCVNYAQPGDTVRTGQRFGLIKFGSRLDLFLPTHAKILVKVGDRITGGITPIAQLAAAN